MSIYIRKTEKKDCPRLLELIQELATYERAPHEVTVSLQQFEESGFGRQPVWWGFSACKKNQLNDEEIIVGFALYYIRYSTWKGQRMYLEDILVTENERGKGIGNLLIHELIQEARNKNLNGIVLQVLEWNEPAIRFYKKFNASFDPEWVNCVIPI
jgi:ribosomal protein S18 acetylase RimI-like enzyme